jgi:hypothetical protein
MNGTYVVSEYQKTYGICDVFLSGFNSGSVDPGLALIAAINLGFQAQYQWPYATPDGDTWVSGFAQRDGVSYRLIVMCKKGKADVCLSTSGTGSVHVQEIPITVVSKYFLGSCSWTLTP